MTPVASSATYRSFFIPNLLQSGLKTLRTLRQVEPSSGGRAAFEKSQGRGRVPPCRRGPRARFPFFTSFALSSFSQFATGQRSTYGLGLLQCICQVEVD